MIFMKLAICCIGKNENRYADEFFRHYISLGADKIFCYDNNDKVGERFNDILTDITRPYVEIVDYRGRILCQFAAYNDCYAKHGNEYDWIMFIDFDEFFHSDKYDSIKEFLSLPRFNDAQIVHLNWYILGDNDQLYYDPAPIVKRFTTGKPNRHIKSIIRGGIDKILFSTNPHCPSYPLLTCVDSLGRLHASNDPFNDKPDDLLMFAEACIYHYATKSAEEFAYKMLRGYPDQIVTHSKMINHIKDYFFAINEYSDEKNAVIKKIFNDNGIKISLS